MRGLNKNARAASHSLTSGVSGVQDCAVPGTDRTKQEGDWAKVELHTIEDVLDAFGW